MGGHLSGNETGLLLVISFEAGGRKKEKQGRNTEETLKRKAREEGSVGEDGKLTHGREEKREPDNGPFYHAVSNGYI